MLVRLHSTVPVATLAKEAKGASSHLITHEVPTGSCFKWQGSYGAFTVSMEDLPGIRRYIEGQAEHHATGRIQAQWEQVQDPEGQLSDG